MTRTGSSACRPVSPGSGRLDPRLPQQSCDIAAKDGELGVDHIPHQTVVHIRITVDENVAECHDVTVLADPAGQFLVEPRQMSYGYF